MATVLSPLKMFEVPNLFEPLKPENDEAITDVEVRVTNFRLGAQIASYLRHVAATHSMFCCLSAVFDLDS